MRSFNVNASKTIVVEQHRNQARNGRYNRKYDQTQARLVFRSTIQISVFLLVASKGYAPSGFANNPNHYFINRDIHFSIESATFYTL